jgi:hypothetical protein
MPLVTDRHRVVGRLLANRFLVRPFKEEQRTRNLMRLAPNTGLGMDVAVRGAHPG